jgi:hypothetical protein
MPPTPTANTPQAAANPPPAPPTPAAHPEPRISLQNPEKIQNGPNGTLKGPGEGDPLKKPEAKNPRNFPNKGNNGVEPGEKCRHEPIERK